MKGRRFVAIAATVLVVGALGGWLAPASLAGTQIQVLDREGFEREVDLGKPGFGPGDVILEIGTLYATDGTTVVGSDFDRIQVLRVLAGGEDFAFFFDGTIRLADGDVILYAEGRFSDVFTEDGAPVAVLGGTGTYAGATGSATIAATANEGEFLITIDLITP